MMETDEAWAERRWVERDATGRTQSGVRAATRTVLEDRPKSPRAFAPEDEDETWIGYAFRKLSRYALIAPRRRRS
jgi:hypothetical protein